MSSDNVEKGAKGETIAVEYLQGKDYKIIKRNFHFGRYGELDIVAQDGKTLVFVEVKTRTSDTYGDPLDSITPKKQKSWRRAAEGYLYVNKIYDQECRFDVITIDLRGSQPKINHIVQAL
jgi:putative endonuclease